MSGREPHKIVTLIGSTRKKWQKRYAEVNRELTLNGFIVISVAIFRHHVSNIEDFRDILESIHYQKIRLADIVVLIHKDAVGPNTRIEMEYCEKIGKPTVTYYYLSQALSDIRAILGDYEATKWKEAMSGCFGAKNEE